MKRLSVLLSLFLLFAALCPAALADGCWLEHSRNGYALASEVDGIGFAGAATSGSLVDQYGVYPAANAFDGQLRTAWAEDRPGLGDGAYLEGAWQARSDGWNVVGVALWAGYQKNDSIYFKNNRPREITLSVYAADRTLLGEYPVTLDDYQGCQCVYFDEWLPLSGAVCVRLTLNGVYGGSKYTDTCVSEMDILVASTAEQTGGALGDMRVVNCNEWVSLRSAPSTAAARLAAVPLGALVRECRVAGSGFVYGEYDGLWGYILLDYLAPAAAEEPLAPETANTPGEVYADSLYALFHGITDEEYRRIMAEGDAFSQRQRNEATVLGSIVIGRAGAYSVGADARAFLEGLLADGWYEKGSSGVEPLLERAREVKLLRSELYGWGSGAENITNADEYYRFWVYVPYWSGGYERHDVLFRVGYEVDGGEWVEGKILGSERVDAIE